MLATARQVNVPVIYGVHGPIHARSLNDRIAFRPGRHLLAAVNYLEIMCRRFTEWRELARQLPAINPVSRLRATSRLRVGLYCSFRS